MKLARIFSILAGFLMITGLAGYDAPVKAEVGSPQPHLVADIIEGPGDAQPQTLIEFQDKLYFLANDGIHGREWWSSDGNEDHTNLVFDLQPGSDGLHINYTEKVLALNNRLYFPHTDPEHGEELWISDGTLAGTHMIKDLFPGIDNSEPKIKLDFKNEVYFTSGYDQSHPPKALWKTDGTPSGTVVIHDAYLDYPDVVYKNFSVNNDNLFFSIDNPYTTGYSTYIELMTTDGTYDGTSLIKTLHPGLFFNYDVASVNGLTFFTFGSPMHELRLYQTDGTDAGTKVVWYDMDYNDDMGLTPVGNWLYFAANDDDYYYGIHRTQGIGSTQLVRNFNPPNSDRQAQDLLDFNGKLVFSINNGNGRHLWISDGTPAGTLELITLSTYQDPLNMTVYRGKVYFTAQDDLHGRELWVTDGTWVGTKLVMDINPGVTSSDPMNLTVAGGTLYFTANDGSHGIELWAYNPFPYSIYAPAIIH